MNASRGPGRNLSAVSVSRSRNLNAAQNSRAIRSALNNRSVNRAFNNRNALRNPGTRALVTTRLATAGWHGRNGWWRHPHGGYGWVGPVFWPFAFYDIYGYSLWGYGYDTAFWDYGYPDIYAGLFAPYGYDDLVGYGGYLRGNSARAGQDSYASANPNDRNQTGLTQMCGEDSRDIAGLPIDAIQKAIQPDDAQRAALDDLANASVKASASIKAACPTEVALTAPRRLAVMQQRIEAMVGAVNTVQPPLEKFYGLLNDEQKAQFNGLAAKPRPGRGGRTGTGSATACGVTQPGLTEWPSEAIEQSVKPTDDQRKGLADLQAAASKAADMLKATCEPDNGATPPARLAAVGKRLSTMLDAVKTVRSAVDKFYTSLSDEQKANFDAIGPKRMGALDQDEGSPPARGHRHAGNVNFMIRRMMSFMP